MATEVRKDLDGLRVRMPGTGEVYLMDKGEKRHVPSVEVYGELFSTWDNVHKDLDLNDIKTGKPLPETAILFRCFDSPKVFLLDGEPGNFVKRHVASPAVMSRYQFSWTRIHVFNVPIDMLNVPDGDSLTKTGRPD